jgi:hypothetical protein
MTALNQRGSPPGRLCDVRRAALDYGSGTIPADHEDPVIAQEGLDPQAPAALRQLRQQLRGPGSQVTSDLGAAA